MSFDAHANFIGSTVAVPPSPAASGLTLTVASGDGAIFPAPPFNCTVNGTGTPEIVRVTGITGDVLTIQRAQEGTSARTIAVNDSIGVTITAKAVTDIEAAVDAVSDALSVEISARGVAINTVSNAASIVSVAAANALTKANAVSNALSIETVARTAVDDALSAAVNGVSAAAAAAIANDASVSAAIKADIASVSA